MIDNYLEIVDIREDTSGNDLALEEDRQISTKTSKSLSLEQRLHLIEWGVDPDSWED